MLLNRSNSKSEKEAEKLLEKEIQSHITEKHKEAAPSFESIMSKCRNSGKSMQTEKELILSNGETITEKQNTNLLKIFLPVLLIIALSALIIMLIPNESGVDSNISGGYFIIDVNPSIELSYDKNGSITEATPLNEDAEIVLYNLDLKDKKYTEAIDLIVEKLIELGYIVKEQKNAVLTTAVNENGVKDDSMTEEIKNAFTETFTKCEIVGEILTGVYDEALNTEAQKYGIDAQKLDLIKKLEDLSVEIPTEEYETVTIRELYHKLSQRQKEIKKEQTDKLKEESEKKKNELNESLKHSIEFLASIIGDKSELKAQLDEMLQKAENGECTPDEVLTILEKMELGGFEIFLDMIISFKTGLEDKHKELDDLTKMLEESNKTVEQKHNDRLEQQKQKGQQRSDKESGKGDKGPDKADQETDKSPTKPTDKQENIDTGKDKTEQSGGSHNQNNEKPEQNKDNDNHFGHQNEHSPRDENENEQKPSEDDKQNGDQGKSIEDFFEMLFG